MLEVLSEFAQRDINLSKIHSRPSKDALGRYIFLVDLYGHREDPLVCEALDRVERITSRFRVFGSYPRFSE